MHVLGVILLVFGIYALLHMNEILEYFEWRPWITKSVRRAVVRKCKPFEGPIVLIGDDTRLASDLGARLTTFRDFMLMKDRPTSVVTTVDEGSMDSEQLTAFYERLRSVPNVVRVRSWFAYTTRQITEMDKDFERCVVWGNVILQRTE